MSSSEEAPALSLAHSTNRSETDRKSALSGAGRELVNGQKWDHFFGVSDGSGTESLSLGSPGLKEPSVESNSTAVVHTTERNNSQAEVPAGVKADRSDHDQRFPDQTPKPASGEESKFALPTIPKKEPEGLPARVTYSHSAPIAGEAVVEKDSPESPFEVIADKLEFDKEFKDVLGSNSGNIDGNWVMQGKRELLHDIPEDGVCEFQVKPRVGGRLPSGPGLSRQSSGTTAALEEVSKCVRDLHSFTNEMLNWDLIPKDLDDKPDDSESSDPPVSLGKDSGIKADAGKASSPPRPLTISAHQKAKPPLGAEENHILVASVKPTPAASAELKADVRWPNPNPPEAADADSSGESDDTIIEDATADPAFQNEKATEINKAPPKPAALVSVDRVTKESPSDKNSKHIPEDGGFMPSKTPEGSWGFIDDFEDIPDKEDVLGGSPVAPSLFPKQSATGTVGQESGPQERDLFGRGSGVEGLGSSSRVGRPLDTLKEGACPDNLNGESFMDFMKECLKAKGRESPEDPVETFSEAELRAARSEVWVPRSQQPPKATQDFEQEHLTIKALMEVGRKSEMEKQSPPTPGKVPSPGGGRRPGEYYEMPPDPSMSAPKSALEKRPLCLEQAVDVKLASTSPGLSAHEFPGVPTKVSPASPLPYAIRKLLAEFSGKHLCYGLYLACCPLSPLPIAGISVVGPVSPRNVPQARSVKTRGHGEAGHCTAPHHHLVHLTTSHEPGTRAVSKGVSAATLCQEPITQSWWHNGPVLHKFAFKRGKMVGRRTR